MVIAASLGAALLYAAASVLQHHSASGQPHEHTMRIRLLARLALRPLWLAGMLSDVGAYALQFFALAHGSLVLVQTLMVCGILFALPLGAALRRGRLSALEWLGAGATVAGLSLFLALASPSPGRGHASLTAWGVILAATLVPAAVMLRAGGPGPGIRRAALLAGATGIAYGLTAALTKATAQLLGQGVVHLFTGWQTYALVAVGAASLLTAQSAFQAGPLRASLPILTVVDPVVSIVIGAIGFGEGLAVSGALPELEALGLMVLAAGVFLLARSPLVSGPAEPAARA